MRDKTVSRTINFSIQDINRLDQLALQRNMIFEEYLAKMIPSRLIPLLESEQLTHEAEELTGEELQYLTRDSLQNLGIEYAEAPREFDAPLNGHIRKIFPFIVALRCLTLLLARQNTLFVAYDLYREFTYNTAKKLKKHLIMRPDLGGPEGYYERGYLDGLPWIPSEDSLQGGYSRTTNTTTSERVRRSESWFHQYYSKANPGAKNSGLLLQLGLVHVVGRLGHGAQIGITAAGAKFAFKFDNPVLDLVVGGKSAPETIDAPISSDERSSFCESIFYRCPIEYRRIYSLLSYVKDVQGTEGVNRSRILDAVMHGYIDGFDDSANRNSTNKDLSGLLGRVWELGLLGQAQDLRRHSRVKRYVVTDVGMELLANPPIL